MMARPLGRIPGFRILNRAVAGGFTWARRLGRNSAETGGPVAGNPPKANPPRLPAVQRPRFTETLETRQMLTASPISFAPAQFYPLITGSVQTGHFINGGLPDLVGIDGTESSAHIFLNNGDGTFRTGQSFYIPQARAVTVGDFNGDGNQDIVIASSSNVFFTQNFADGTTNNNLNNATGGQSTLFIFYGNGDGTFQTPAHQIGVNYSITDIVTADLNLDGKPDLIATVGLRALVMLNVGGGKFARPVAYPAGAEISGQLVTGDFNHDGVPDIAVTRFQANQIAVLLGQKDVNGVATGTFGKRVIYRVGTNPRALAIADFNGDGNPDLVVANAGFRKPAFSVFLGNGDGSFSKPNYYYGGNFVDGIASGDFNADGHPDVATVSFTSFLRAYAGNGDGTFQPFHEFGSSAYGQNVVSADFNGDGRDDVAIATGGGVRVLLSTSQVAPPVSPTALDLTLGGGAPRSITYRDVSGSTATISLSGPGAATVHFLGANLSLNRTGNRLVGGAASVASIGATATTSATTLSISPQTPHGVVSLNGISTDGSFKAISAPGVNLTGDLSIAGTVGSILLGDVSAGIITLGSAGAAANLTFNNATDEILRSSQPIGALTVGQWYSPIPQPTSLLSPSISAPSIRQITATHQFLADMIVDSGGLGSIRAANIPSGDWNIVGPVGTIRSSQDIQLTLSATSIGRIAAVDSLNNLVVYSTGSIGAISAGNMSNSTISAGVGALAQRLPQSASDFVNASSIGSVDLQSRFKKVSFANSSLAAASLGRMSLGVVAFTNFGMPQGLAAKSIGSFSGADVVTKKSFSLKNPTTLAPLVNKGINTGDFSLFSASL